MKPVKTTITARAIAVGLAGVLGLSGLVLGGCRGDRSDKPPRRFFPDMDDQQKWDPQEETDLFADGRTARPWVEGTVAFGTATWDPRTVSEDSWAKSFLAERDELLAEDDAIYTGQVARADGTAAYVDNIPVRVTSEMIDHGQERFNIYCAACHGFLGDGQGMVGQKWSYPVANLLTDVYRDRSQRQGKDGYLWEVAREGVWDPATGANRMPGYKHALDAADAWAIVAYLRTLQAAQGVPVDELPSADRQRIGARAAAEPAGEPIASADGSQTQTGGAQ